MWVLEPAKRADTGDAGGRASDCRLCAREGRKGEAGGDEQSTASKAQHPRRGGPGRGRLQVGMVAAAATHQLRRSQALRLLFLAARQVGHARHLLHGHAAHPVHEPLDLSTPDAGGRVEGVGGRRRPARRPLRPRCLLPLPRRLHIGIRGRAGLAAAAGAVGAVDRAGCYSRWLVKQRRQLLVNGACIGRVRAALYAQSAEDQHHLRDRAGGVGGVKVSRSVEWWAQGRALPCFLGARAGCASRTPRLAVPPPGGRPHDAPPHRAAGPPPSA